MSLYNLPEADERLRPALEHLCRLDADLAAAYAVTGLPPVRRQSPAFAGLVRIIAGQQVSTHAAAAILNRLHDAVVPFTPQRLLETEAQTLRACGLSAAKLRYARALSEALVEGTLDLAALPALDDAAVAAALTALPGFGRWSAEMYLLFALQRPDVWPVGDLAIRSSYQRLKNMPERPDAKQLDALGEAYRPHRSALARFLWHAYRHPGLA